MALLNTAHYQPKRERNGWRTIRAGARSISGKPQAAWPAPAFGKGRARPDWKSASETLVQARFAHSCGLRCRRLRDEAVQASATAPGVVIPVQSNERTLVDGGVLTIVPVRFVRAMGAGVVIAVDIYCGKPSALRGNALDTVLKTFRLQSCLLSEAETAEADILIRPAFEPDNPVSFSQRDEAIMAGYRATADAIPALKAKIAAWQPRPE